MQQLNLRSRDVRVKGRALACTVLGFVAVFSVMGCSKHELAGVAKPNQPPTMRLSQAPAQADSNGSYLCQLSWIGFDPDGRVTSYFYAVDPPSRLGSDTTWTSTTANRLQFKFSADSVSSDRRSSAAHTVVLYCVDNDRARSPLVSASFTTTTIPPTVQILTPQPSALYSPSVSPTVRVEWTGDDPDGIDNRLPASFRWKLFGVSSVITPAQILFDPDTLRRRYAPRFTEWDSLDGHQRSVNLRDLVPGQSYVFAIVAIDVAGAYSAVFSANTNILSFSVAPAGTLGPTLTLSGPSFNFTYPSGGTFLDPATFVHAEYAASHPIEVQWSARPAPGSFILGYRWAVDITSIDDPTPRADESNDLAHWSRLTTATSEVLPGYAPPGSALSATHLLYVQALDNLGSTSLGVVQFVVIRPSFDLPLLIVDDTWFTPDRSGATGCVQSAAGNWPSAAELDTFLYAVGDKPYRCYPAGTRSPAGVFAGYAFDTLNTHLTLNSRLNLQLLDRYRNIIWMTDITSALLYTGDPHVTSRPIPLLRAWSAPGSFNPLVTWMIQGGRLWLTGGGAAFASLRDYDSPGSPLDVYAAALGELVPGRFMYDIPHWRSELTVRKSLRASRSGAARGTWPGAPPLDGLPVELDEKSAETDPLPPLRTGGFYSGSYSAEHLSKANAIAEIPAAGLGPASTLDTLYTTLGGDAGTGWPVMTLYHGRDNGACIFAGFPPWYFQRAQLIQLVDFVLHDVWGLNRRPVPR